MNDPSDQWEKVLLVQWYEDKMGMQEKTKGNRTSILCWQQKGNINQSPAPKIFESGPMRQSAFAYGHSQRMV